MSLVLVDPDSSSLRDQLQNLGYELLAVTDTASAKALCERSEPAAVICTQLASAVALAEAHRRLPVVLARQGRIERQALLDALHAGLADVWELPLSEQELRDSLDGMRGRLAAAASDAEARLNQHIADLQRDQRAGRYIQMGMLPPSPMAIDQYRLAHRILPSLILSGDFVDYFRITDRHFAFYVADVSGHGASSAFVTVLLKNFSRRLRREFRPSMLTSPGEILQWFNDELLEQNMDKHVALILAVGDLQENLLRLVNAGHFPPAIMVNGAGATFIEQRGKPVGLFENVDYAPLEIRFEAGDALVVFSDGVLDALGDEPLAAKERRLLDAAASGSTPDAIWEALGIDPAAAAPDDMTCLTVRRES